MTNSTAKSNFQTVTDQVKEQIAALHEKRKTKIELHVARRRCEKSHLDFVRYFFQKRQGIRLRINWHHVLKAREIEKVITGETENLVLNEPPGSSKTEFAVINLIARGLALNSRARFLHLSGSDQLALLNSETARDIVTSDHYQAFWPIPIASDADSKKRWNTEVNGQKVGGVYATALGGQVVGFRAGHMEPGFQGAIIIDDPNKPEDAFNKAALMKANRKLLTTVKSRRANPKTPIVVIMQRVGEGDVTEFIESGNLDGKWKFVKIPALITIDTIKELAPDLLELVDMTEQDANGRFSYWPYKEPLADLLKMETGQGSDSEGSRISRFVFASQYDQRPKSIGGNIIQGSYFVRYKVLPKLKYRKIYADTAQKTKTHNDWSVFAEWGLGIDDRAYLLSLTRGKWESPELRKRAIALWAMASDRDPELYGELRKMVVEDKSSGTDLIQTLSLPPPEGANILIDPMERNIDKVVRCMDALPYIEASLVCVPEDAPFTNDFIAEHEAFSADGTHKFDDQVDTTFDMVMDLLSSRNILKTWEALGSQAKQEGDHRAAKESESLIKKYRIRSSKIQNSDEGSPQVDRKNSLAERLDLQL